MFTIINPPGLTLVKSIKSWFFYIRAPIIWSGSVYNILCVYTKSIKTLIFFIIAHCIKSHVQKGHICYTVLTLSKAMSFTIWHSQQNSPYFYKIRLQCMLRCTFNNQHLQGQLLPEKNKHHNISVSVKTLFSPQILTSDHSSCKSILVKKTDKKNAPFSTA